MSALATLAEFAGRSSALGEDELHRARRPILDTLAVMMASRGEPVTDAARQFAGSTVAIDGMEARDVITGQRLPATEASFVNGVAGHALDFDDVSMAMSGHPSTLLVPVALAVGESTGSTVEDLLQAYCIGLRIDVAVSAGFNLFGHYNRGWHASVTVGSLGAAGVAARLLGLTVPQTRHALGIAVSMASGTRQNFGTMTKPLHIGLAAHNAVRAARLAALGIDASPAALDGPLGFFALYGTSTDDSTSPGKTAAAVEASLAGTAGQVLATLSVKRYPCCYQTHRAIDAALDVRAALGDTINVEDIEFVIVHVNPGSDTSLIHQYATTSTEGRFCLRYTVAEALLHGQVDFSSFTDAAVRAESAQTLMRRVDVRYSQETPYESVDYEVDYATIQVTLTSGTVRYVTCTAPRGNAARPLTDDDLIAKADTCLVRGGLRPEASRLLAVLEQPQTPVSAVVDTLTQLTNER